VTRGTAGGSTYLWHDMFAQICVCVAPGGAVGNDIVGAGGSQLGHHQGGRGRGDDDGAVEAQGTG
jgi:hypothetical protein